MRNEMKPFIKDELWMYQKMRPDDMYGTGVRYFNKPLNEADIRRHKYDNGRKVINSEKRCLLLEALEIKYVDYKRINTEFIKAIAKTNVCESMRNSARAIGRRLYISSWSKQEYWLHLMKKDNDFEVLEWDVEKTEFGWNYKIKGNHLIYYND